MDAPRHVLNQLQSDLRYSLRQLTRAPALAALVIGTLAVGIGANTALFTMADAIFTRPLPGVRGSERLVWITPIGLGGGGPRALAYPDFQDYRALHDVFSDATAFANVRMAVRAKGEPEEVRGQIVTSRFFGVLGARMALGRGFLPQEDSTPGTHSVAVLSHTFWQREFAGDSAIVGKTIAVNGAPFTIVGVAEERFNGPAHGEVYSLWVPLSMVNRVWPQNRNALTSRGVWWLESIGRLRPEVTLPQASSAAVAVAARIALADTATHAGITARIQAMRSGVRPGDMNDVVPVATLAIIVTVLVLLIACSNVSNILLSRAVARRREIAVRLSIGASRFQLVRQLLTESAVFATAASVFGVLLSLWATALLAARIPAPVDVAVDGRVLVFALGAAGLTTILFGLVPALHATRGDVSSTLKTASPGRNAGRARLQSVFVVAQLALSLVLLSTAGLFLSSVREATQMDVGFDASRNVLALSFDLGMQGYTSDKALQFARDLEQRARALPGVEQAAFANPVPLGERIVGAVPSLEQAREGGGTRMEERREMETYLHTISPGYFATLALPLARGRDFVDADAAGAPPVAIVSELFAAQAWPKEDAIGKRLSVTGETGTLLTVVGVAKDALLAGVAERSRPIVYVAQRQRPNTLELTLLVRSRGDAAALAAPLRSAIRAMDGSLPITGMQTLAQYRWDRLAESRLGSGILSIFGALALLLATVGVYAVIAFSVAQRTREIGVRVALGAIQRQVVSLFVRQGMRLTAYGLAIGLALSVALAKALSAIFMGVSPTDVAALGAVSLLLLMVALLASWLPARRAARVDPMEALRSE